MDDSYLHILLDAVEIEDSFEGSCNDKQNNLDTQNNHSNSVVNNEKDLI